jgi:DNA-binding transcriptional LysR family regulator
MAAPGDDLSELRLADLATFLTIVRSGSISGAARALRVTPSQVSKAVSRLEHQLHVKLLARGARGVALNEVGRELVPRVEDVLARVSSLKALGGEAPPELTLVAAAWLNSLFLPRIVEHLPDVRVRILELPPGAASAYATGHSFDIALTTGTERWPATWAHVRVGTFRRALFASPRVARRLGPVVREQQLRSTMFMGPVYSYHGQLVSGDDGCPLHPGERRTGHQTQSLSVALDLATRIDQVVFAPVLSARSYVERGLLVEIPVEGWDVRVPLYLACNAEEVRARMQKEILAALRSVLEEEPSLPPHKGLPDADAKTSAQREQGDEPGRAGHEPEPRAARGQARA